MLIDILIYGSSHKVLVDNFVVLSFSTMNRP